MYTVKRIDDRSGHQTVVSAISVSFDADKHELTAHSVAEAVDYGGGRPRVVRSNDVTYSSGHIYVMNGDGKTVAAYNLEKQEQKHG